MWKSRTITCSRLHPPAYRILKLNFQSLDLWISQIPPATMWKIVSSLSLNWRRKSDSLTEKRPYVIIEIITFTQENVIRGEGSITSPCSGDEPTILPRENRESSGDRVYIHIRGPFLESPGSFKTYWRTVVVYEFKIGVLTVFQIT